jgi:hypothetical protein
VPFKTFVNDDTLTASDLNDFLMAQAVITCTSVTRPTAVQGMVIYETDTDTIRVHDDSTWPAIWRKPDTYTPTLSGMAIGSGGSATNTADWSFAGGTLTVRGTITFGTSGSTFPSTTSTMSLPAGFTATSSSPRPVGSCVFDDAGALFPGVVTVNSTTTVRLFALNAASTYLSQVTPSSTIPFTWAASDAIRWQATITGTF